MSLNRWKLCPFIARASLIFQLAVSSCSNINHMRSAAGSFRSVLWRLWKASHYYLKYLHWLSLSTTDLVFPRNTSLHRAVYPENAAQNQHRERLEWSAQETQSCGPLSCVWPRTQQEQRCTVGRGELVGWIYNPKPEARAGPIHGPLALASPTGTRKN